MVWTIKDSQDLYQIQEWGEPYFSIDDRGNVCVSLPHYLQNINLDLLDLVERYKKKNIELPLLIRFSPIVGDRLSRLVDCFKKAISDYQYDNIYQPIFPIKCNQHDRLIRDLVNYGDSYNLGLEVGSKAELAIALANLNNELSLLICNGYKDREYIETALLSGQLGNKIIIVIEQFEELSLVLKLSQELGIKPIIGVRAKLNTQGIGRWGNSTGERAKFGLSIPQIVEIIEELLRLSLLDCLQLLHFHIGSQISSIAVIKNAIREASQIYVQLVKMGAKMGYLDVGGGLAVDYDGSKSNVQASKNYNMQNYANDIVAQIKDACDVGKISSPIILSESGRAIASHQSVLIFDVLNTSDVPEKINIKLKEEEHLVIRNFWQTYQSISEDNYQEAYHDAIQFKEEALSLFNLGYFSLIERSIAEEIYWGCCRKIARIISDRDYVPEDLLELEKSMASIYHINLSVFRSVPDSWAINQLFPIMPIHRLKEQPKVKGILADLTCDSDGKIDRFINLQDYKEVLELHSLSSPQPYYLGMFLVGAYQEIMGNLHNLFGDTNVVHISLDSEGNIIESLIRGDTIKDVLSYVEYDRDKLLQIISDRIKIAIEKNYISQSIGKRLLENYTQNLDRYTYLKVDR